MLTGVDQVPHPTPTPEGVQLTVLDVGWDVTQLFAGGSWLAEATLTADHTVLVAAATVPSLRRLETTLAHFEDLDRVLVAVVGPRRKKWPKCVEHSAGPRTRRLLGDGGGVVEIPVDRERAVTGLDSKPLPQPLIRAAEQILSRLGHPTITN